MTISILIVDDVQSIAQGFAKKFQRVFEERNMDVHIESLCSSDEAVNRMMQKNENIPTFDLLFTDIDLSGGDHPDKAGAIFAKFAKTLYPDIPVVGCSGRFESNDLSDDERSMFDRWWPKNGLSQSLDEITENTIQLAIDSHKRKKSVVPSSLPNTATSDTTTEPKQDGIVLYTPKTTEEFEKEGYIQIFIEPTEKNGFIKPFAIWKKDSEEGVELEVADCNAIFSWGDSYEDAEAGIMEIIEELSTVLNDPDESFSASLLQAKRFVESVTGAHPSLRSV